CFTPLLPSPTLVPYTTLFRSGPVLAQQGMDLPRFDDEVDGVVGHEAPEGLRDPAQFELHSTRFRRRRPGSPAERCEDRDAVPAHPGTGTAHRSAAQASAGAAADSTTTEPSMISCFRLSSSSVSSAGTSSSNSWNGARPTPPFSRVPTYGVPSNWPSAAPE